MIKKVARPGRKTSKVVCINAAAPEASDRARLVAADSATQRYILAIGGERIAYDLTTRITRLAPTTGDHPAPIVPLKVPTGKRPARDKAK